MGISGAGSTCVLMIADRITSKKAHIARLMASARISEEIIFSGIEFLLRYRFSHIYDARGRNMKKDIAKAMSFLFTVRPLRERQHI